MTRIGKWIVIGMLVLLATLVVVGFLLPSGYRVERSIVIDADREHVHALVSDLRRWPEWTPWQEIDPTIRTVYGEKTTGVGAHQVWSGESGGGELTFIRCDPDTGIVYEMHFGEDRNRSLSSIEYEAVPEGTRVTWAMAGDFGLNLAGRYVGLMMDRMVGGMFEDGLRRLKARAEASEDVAA
jgi:hypothetical protein